MLKLEEHYNVFWFKRDCSSIKRESAVVFSHEGEAQELFVQLFVLEAKAGFEFIRILWVEDYPKDASLEHRLQKYGL